MKKNSITIRKWDIFYQLTKRHFLVFFKNKIRVFYTLMVPLIILAVYVCFLRGLELQTVKNTLYELGITPNDEILKHINIIVDSWMLSGIIALSTITISIQTNNIIINDKENGVNRDFASSPIHRNYLIASYFVFNFLVTLLICFIVLLICLLYLAFMKEFSITFVDFITMIAVLCFTTMGSTLFTIFICSFINRESTLASIIAIFSAAAGFLIGAYMPLSMFPNWLSNLCCFFPGTYACSLMRYSFLLTPINNLVEYLENSNIIANYQDLVSSLTNGFGYNLEFFNMSISVSVSSAINFGFIIVFAALNIFSAKYLARISDER